jgi:RNA polymerase sigma-70 factor (ECF subfamily)
MDTDLVIRAQDGDEIAFARLADGVYGRLQQLAYRILRDPELARDAAQQTALSMWRNLPQLRDPRRFEAWSYRLCVNACYTESKRRSRSIQVTGSAPHREPVAPDEYDRVVDHDQLERGFRRLSMDHRVVLVLHHYLGMPIDQVARTLDIPLGTVKSRKNRALAQMRRVLEADAAPGPRAMRREEVTR